MRNEIFVNVGPRETRVAVRESDKIVELHIERANERGVVGGIYKGRVTRVLPGMQAAFVDIGLERAGFLYVGDYRSEIDDDASDDDNGGGNRSRRRSGSPPQIEDVLDLGRGARPAARAVTAAVVVVRGVVVDLGAVVAHIQEAGPFQADVHEGRLHPRKDPGDSTLVDASHDAALV